VAFTQSDQVGQLGAAAEQLVTTAQQAFVGGISGSLLLAAGVVAAAAVIVARLAPGPTARGDSGESTTDESQDEDRLVRV
jgi:hypothetical protein